MADHAASYQEAKRLLASGEPADRELAATLFAGAAQAGHVPSQFRLGELHLQDEDPQVQSEGLALVAQAAAAGHPPACFYYGLLHAHGRAGHDRDLTAAAEWCAKAARAGSGAAQFNLGLLYADGGGVAADPMQAVRWLRQEAL